MKSIWRNTPVIDIGNRPFAVAAAMLPIFASAYPLAPTSPEPLERPDVIAAFNEVARLERQRDRFAAMAQLARIRGHDGTAKVLEDGLFRTNGKLTKARALAALLSGRSIETDRLEDR